MMPVRTQKTWRMRAAGAALTAATVAAGCGGAGQAADSAVATTPALPADSKVAVAPALTTDSAIPVKPSPSAGRAAPAPPAQAADTIRGIVSEVGSRPMTSVVVRPASGGAVTITGALAAEIARAAGAEVWVSGQRGPQGLAAAAYAVRAVDGEQAIDGVLAGEGERLVLVTPAGRRPIARPLQAFRGMIGARVWLVGPLDGTITSYGVLREP